MEAGFPGHTTPEQDAAQRQLEGRVASQLSTPGGANFVMAFGGKDVCLLRMLRARKFDVDAAAALVQEIIDYRAQHALDGLAERILQGQPLQDAANPNWKPEIKDPSISRVLPHLPCGRHGFTRNGQPIEIWRISMLRPADILTVDRDDLWNWWHFHLECGLKAVLDGAAKFKATPTGSILVFDLKGFGARHLNRACLNVLKTLFAVGSSKAPESTSKIFILNAPTIFSGVWALIKPVLEERTRNKIVITNKQTDAALLELVSDDVLPTFLGGKCPCSIGEKISNSGASFTEAQIKARGDLKIAVDVAEGGVLGWEFMLESHDIKFGVYRFHSGSYTDKLAVTSGDVVRPLSKSETKGELQAETLENCKGGTYVLYWDNSYSMMTAKTLKYIYEVA